MTRTLRRALLAVMALTLLLVLAAALLLGATLQREPGVALQHAPDENDVARALGLLRAHDPRRAVPGMPRAVAMTERDLDVLLNHAAARRIDAITRVGFERGTATVAASVHLPAHPLSAVFGRWLNLQVRLQETGGLPTVVSLHAGSLPVPLWLAQPLALRLLHASGVQAEWQLVEDVVQRVGFVPQQMTVVYAWRDDSTERVVSALVPAVEQQRLRAYADRLAALTQGLQATGWTTSMAPLLGPLFTLARQRSAGGSAEEAAAENRAALVVLTLFVNGRGVDALLPAARNWPRPRMLQVVLAGRDDFPRHWLVSAALAVEGSGPLSKAIGIYKEVADARGGSGFSFNDIAADRAGTRVGELAINAPRQLQDKLAAGVQESDFMPPVADLPEFMTEADFVRRYGGVGAPAYTAMIEEIDRRIGALPLLRR